MQKRTKMQKKKCMNMHKCMFNFKYHAKKPFQFRNSYKKGKNEKKRMHIFSIFFCFYMPCLFAFLTSKFMPKRQNVKRHGAGIGDTDFFPCRVVSDFSSHQNFSCRVVSGFSCHQNFLCRVMSGRNIFF